MTGKMHLCTFALFSAFSGPRRPPAGRPASDPGIRASAPGSEPRLRGSEPQIRGPGLGSAPRERSERAPRTPITEGGYSGIQGDS